MAGSWTNELLITIQGHVGLPSGRRSRQEYSVRTALMELLPVLALPS
jgi:hypothetical protein